MFSQEGMVIVNLMNLEWGRQWDKNLMMFAQTVVVRDIQWEIHLGKNMELREAPMIRYGVILVHNTDLS